MQSQPGTDQYDSITRRRHYVKHFLRCYHNYFCFSRMSACTTVSVPHITEGEIAADCAGNVADRD